MDLVTSVPILAVVTAGLIAAVTDVWNYKVPNWLTLPLLACGLVFHAATGGWVGLGFSLGGATFGFAVLIVCYILGGVGAGDVKFMAAVGAWLGLVVSSQVFLVAGFTVGIWSIVAMSIRGGFGAFATHMAVMCYQFRSIAFHLGTGEKVEQVVQRQDRRGRVVPLAAMITIGIITVLLAQQVFHLSLVSILLGV